MVPGSAELSAVETFLRVNRDVRRENYDRLIRITDSTANKKLWAARV